MSTSALTKPARFMPSVFDDFLKPWDEWFDGGFKNRVLNVPAVNITEHKTGFEVSMAAPGLKKEDFMIKVDGNMLTISCEKEEKSETGEKRFTKQEYSYTSFSRSFTLPDDVVKENIEAKYEEGVLHIVLPCKDIQKTIAAKQIPVS